MNRSVEATVRLDYLRFLFRISTILFILYVEFLISLVVYLPAGEWREQVIVELFHTEWPLMRSFFSGAAATFMGGASFLLTSAIVCFPVLLFFVFNRLSNHFYGLYKTFLMYFDGFGSCIFGHVFFCLFFPEYSYSAFYYIAVFSLSLLYFYKARCHYLRVGILTLLSALIIFVVWTGWYSLRLREQLQFRYESWVSDFIRERLLIDPNYVFEKVPTLELINLMYQPDIVGAYALFSAFFVFAICSLSNIRGQSTNEKC